jgi:hypothetical protein
VQHEDLFETIGNVGFVGLGMKHEFLSYKNQFEIDM